MKGVVFYPIMMSLFLTLASCGKPTSSAINAGGSSQAPLPTESSTPDNASEQTPATNASSGPQHVTLKPSTQSSAPLFSPQDFTVDPTSGDVSLLTGFGNLKTPVALQGKIDPHDGVAHLQGTDPATEGYATCLNPEDCSSDMVVTLYRNDDGKLVHSQFVTESPQPENMTVNGNEKVPDEDEEEPDENYGEYTAPPSTLVPPPNVSLSLARPPLSSSSVSLAYGRYNHGWLLKAVVFPVTGPGFIRPKKGNSGEWGTDTLVNLLVDTMGQLNQMYPSSLPLKVGPLSREGGRFFPPHKSHQNGLDADIGYPLTVDVKGAWPLCSASGKWNPQCDIARVWAYFKILAETEKVPRVFVDSGIKKAICQYVTEHGEFPRNVTDNSFKALAMLQPAKGHDDHFHVRAQCPEDQQTHCKKIEMKAYSGLQETGCSM